MMVSFVLSFFPRDVLDEILNLIESVSEDFPSYSYREKASISKIQKLQNLFHFNEQGISCIESLVVSNVDASAKCCKRIEQSWLLAYEFMGRLTWQILQ